MRPTRGSRSTPRSNTHILFTQRVILSDIARACWRGDIRVTGGGFRRNGGYGSQLSGRGSPRVRPFRPADRRWCCWAVERYGAPAEGGAEQRHRGDLPDGRPRSLPGSRWTRCWRWTGPCTTSSTTRIPTGAISRSRTAQSTAPFPPTIASQAKRCSCTFAEESISCSANFVRFKESWLAAPVIKEPDQARE